MRKCLLVVNEGSGKADSLSRVRQRLGQTCQIRESVLRPDLDLTEAIGSAQSDGCDLLVVAGGDGTVNAAVNAMMRLQPDRRMMLAIAPMGTANDFAHTLQLPDDPVTALRAIERGHTVNMDVIEITSRGCLRHFANVAAGGNSVRVSEQMTEEMKERWGSFCYIRGSIDVLADMETYRVRVKCDDETFELDSWGIIIANGRTNAGRIPVAPKASPCDGLMDVIIIRDGTLVDMAEIVSKTLLDRFLECEQVLFRQAQSVVLRSTPPMRFTIDGEVIDEEPVRFDVIAGAIRVYVGIGM